MRCGNPARVIKAFDVVSGKWLKIKNQMHLDKIISDRGSLAHFIIPISYLISLQVEVSSACNLKCPQCFNQIKGHKKGFMSRDLWNQKIRPFLPQLKDIHLVGIGEPLLCPDFFYFVEESVKNNVKVHTTSNLQLVDDDIAEKIVLSGIKELSFSCDGATKEIYEKIRINGTLEKLESSLEKINYYKAKHNSTYPNLTLNFGAIKSNIEELPKVVKLAHKHKVKLIIAYHDVIYREDLKEESLYHHQELSDHKFIKAIKTASDLGIQIFTPGLFSKPNKSCNQSIYCNYPFHHLWISSDGRVGPCCMDFPDRITFGNLNDSTIDEVWNNREILNLRKDLATFNPSYTCQHCVNHGKTDISECANLFRFKGSEKYINLLKGT